MKLMDRPTVTEMDRGGVYEMDRQTNLPKKGYTTEIDKIISDFPLQVPECVITFDLFQWHFMFFALFRLSISEAHPLSISVALGLSIHFTGTFSTTYTLHYTLYYLHYTQISIQQYNNKQ